MHVYHINIRHQFQNSWTILIYFVLAGLFPFYMTYEYGSHDVSKYTLVATVFFGIFFIPQLILHLNHYLVNKGDTFFYNSSNRTITIDRKGVSCTFTFNDIDIIHRYKSFPLAEDRMQWFPWDSYNFSVINLKDGKKFVVTSLLVPNMDLPIEESKVQLHKVFYKLAS